MRTTKLVTTILVLGAASVAAADVRDDACSMLSDTVYRQVVGAGGTTSTGTMLPLAGTRRFVCLDTARAVSEGFSRAMGSMNRYIIWPGPELHRGDVCLSHDLSQCYPDLDPFVPLYSLYDAAFIVQQWRAVQTVVSASMPAGTASDVSHFDPPTVGHRLQRVLAHDRHVRH